MPHSEMSSQLNRFIKVLTTFWAFKYLSYDLVHVSYCNSCHLSCTLAIDWSLHHKEIDVPERYRLIHACSMSLTLRGRQQIQPSVAS
jgi:hypothetical protein